MGTKAARVVAISERAHFDQFDAKTKETWSVFSGHGTSPNTSLSGAIGSGPPGVPGRRPASELNPFDARTVPTSKEKAKSGIQAEVDGKGATLPLGEDRDARLASIKTEVEGEVGNDAGPADARGDVGLDGNKIVDAMMKGAATGATAAGAMAAATGGAAAPLILRGAVQGAVIGGIGEVGGQLIPVARVAVTQAIQDAAEPAPPAPSGTPPAGSTPPAGMGQAPAGDKADGGTESEASEGDKVDGGGTDKADGGTESNLDPTHHGNGRNYEGARQAYLGHADGTPFGARGTRKEGGPADPRKANPGRDHGPEDGPSEETRSPSINDLALVADPYRRAKVDPRATHLLEGGRVTGRVILVDPDAENSNDNNGNRRAKPKDNGLVR